MGKAYTVSVIALPHTIHNSHTAISITAHPQSSSSPRITLYAPHRTAHSPSSCRPSYTPGAPFQWYKQSCDVLAAASRRTGVMSRPSIVTFGCTPKIAATVGKMSYVVTTSEEVRIGATFPGQRTMPGSRIPPSHVVVLPSRSGPALPPCSFWISHGPLSAEEGGGGGGCGGRGGRGGVRDG